MGRAQKPKRLEFWMINNTQDTNLENVRFDQKPLTPLNLREEMPAGHSHLSQIPREPGCPETERLVVYKSDFFTLAIFVHMEWNGSKRLQLELSRGMVHLGNQDDLKKTFSRMSEMKNPPDTKTTAVTRCKLRNRGEVSTWLLAGPYKLKATLSYHTEYILKVKLKEQKNN